MEWVSFFAWVQEADADEVMQIVDLRRRLTSLLRASPMPSSRRRLSRSKLLSTAFPETTSASSRFPLLVIVLTSRAALFTSTPRSLPSAASSSPFSTVRSRRLSCEGLC